MADISKIKTLDGTTYNIKDAAARAAVFPDTLSALVANGTVNIAYKSYCLVLVMQAGTQALTMVLANADGNCSLGHAPGGNTWGDVAMISPVSASVTGSSGARSLRLKNNTSGGCTYLCIAR